MGYIMGKVIDINGFKIKKLSETSYEAENTETNLDFYFEINSCGEVDTFIFDSTKSNDEAFINSFTEQNLEDAVELSMSYRI